MAHTERPEEDCWASFDRTIGRFFSLSDQLELPSEFREILATMKHGFLKDTFTDFTDRAPVITAYRDNSRKVRKIVPADRLLVFNVADGGSLSVVFWAFRSPTPLSSITISGRTSGSISVATEAKGGRGVGPLVFRGRR
ncbi:MAG: hypothetical protein GY788_09825 [bacterium]|nr:hypothetical protein [bacterium]